MQAIIAVSLTSLHCQPFITCSANALLPADFFPSLNITSTSKSPSQHHHTNNPRSRIHTTPSPNLLPKSTSSSTLPIPISQPSEPTSTSSPSLPPSIIFSPAFRSSHQSSVPHSAVAVCRGCVLSLKVKISLLHFGSIGHNGRVLNAFRCCKMSEWVGLVGGTLSLDLRRGVKKGFIAPMERDCGAALHVSWIVLVVDESGETGR